MPPQRLPLLVSATYVYERCIGKQKIILPENSGYLKPVVFPVSWKCNLCQRVFLELIKTDACRVFLAMRNCLNIFSHSQYCPGPPAAKMIPHIMSIEAHLIKFKWSIYGEIFSYFEVIGDRAIVASLLDSNFNVLMTRGVLWQQKKMRLLMTTRYCARMVSV